jgi:DNA-binding response OmpR family regulator
MKRILIIEDDTDTSDLLTVLLTAQRFAVVRAHSVREGIRKYAEERPDVVLLDLGPQ